MIISAMPARGKMMYFKETITFLRCEIFKITKLHMRTTAATASLDRQLWPASE